MTGNRVPIQAAAICACRTCGMTAPMYRARITGVWSVVHGAAVWDCETCMKAQLQDIEAGLHRAG